MKNKVILHFATAALACITFTCVAQSPLAETQKSVLQKFTILYNQQKFDTIYSMLGSDAQKKLPQQMFTSFLSAGLYKTYGDIKGVDYLSEKNKTVQYLTTFNNGQMDMYFAIDSLKKIMGIKFLPHKTTNASWKPLITDNKKATITDNYVDSAVQAFCKNTYRVGLSIAIINKDGQHLYNYGETKKGNDTLPTAETIFEIGSISKTFTAWLFSEAIEKKLVKPGDDMRKYIKGAYPNLERNGKPITLMDLANHTSGLPRIPSDLDKQPNYNEADPYKNYSGQMMFDFLKTVKLQREPGAVSSYSNYGMALLGVIMEDVFKSTYEKLIVQYITTPLGMKDTYINVPQAKEKQQASVYTDEGKETLHWHVGDMSPCGGISSTLNDMILYVKANYDEKTNVLKRIHQPTIALNDTITVACGWHLRKMKNGSTMVWHNGGTEGSASFCGYIPNTNIMIILLSNTGLNCDELALNLLNRLIKE